MRHAITSLLLVSFVLVASVGCGPGDPRTEVLKQRSRWTAELISWIPKDDGNLVVEIRFSGPPNTTLDQLTFRLSQLDAGGGALSTSWHTIDPADVPLGAPKELMFNVPASEGAEGMAAEIVLGLTAEDEQHIPELQGL